MESRMKIISTKVVPDYNIAFEAGEGKIRNIILSTAKRKKQVIYGAEAMNVQSPPALRRFTSDIDIYARKPKRSAMEVSRKLNKEIGKGFVVNPAKHRGTYKVRYTGFGDGMTIADYSRMPRKIDARRIGGVMYESLPSIMKGKKKTLGIKSKKFRWEREKEDIGRISLMRLFR